MLPPAGSPFPSASGGRWALGYEWERRRSFRRCRLGTSLSRVWFPAAAAAASRNKVLPCSSPSWWCSAPVPPTCVWRRGALRGSPVQESVAGDSSRGEFAGLLFQGWRGSFGWCGGQESGVPGSVVLWRRLSATASRLPRSQGLGVRPRPMDLQRLLRLVQVGGSLLRFF